MGYKNAYVLFGGYYHWVNSGREIYDASKQVRYQKKSIYIYIYLFFFFSSSFFFLLISVVQVTKEVLPQHLLAATLLPGEIVANAEEYELNSDLESDLASDDEKKKKKKGHLEFLGRKGRKSSAK